ncbi:MAG: YlxR family protein [Firmicutes bacterium]|nr:YlxR family protein [Bacillota bacterium]
MKVKKVPMRTCVGCNVSQPKKSLVRVVRTPDGTLMVDRKGKVSGRGAYVCPNEGCIQTAIKTRRLERALEHALDAEVVATLMEIATKESHD